MSHVGVSTSVLSEPMGHDHDRTRVGDRPPACLEIKSVRGRYGDVVRVHVCRQHPFPLASSEFPRWRCAIETHNLTGSATRQEINFSQRRSESDADSARPLDPISRSQQSAKC